MKVVSKFLKRSWSNVAEFAKRLWSDMKYFMRRPWTVGRVFNLLYKAALAAFVFIIVALAVMVSTSPRVVAPTSDEKIAAFCSASPGAQVEIKYQTKLWMLLNRPENPRVTQGWGYGLTDAQMIAFLKIGDGVSPCPWPPGQ